MQKFTFTFDDGKKVTAEYGIWSKVKDDEGWEWIDTYEEHDFLPQYDGVVFNFDGSIPQELREYDLEDFLLNLNSFIYDEYLAYGSKRKYRSVKIVVNDVEFFWSEIKDKKTRSKKIEELLVKLRTGGEKNS